MNRKKPETFFSSDKKDYRIVVLLVAGILVVSFSFLNQHTKEKSSKIPQELRGFLATAPDQTQNQVVRSLFFLPVQINLADQRILQTIPGIGARLSSRIVALRQERNGFHNLSELLDVEGIGEQKYNRIKKYSSL